jgi:hypothetical protein
MSIIDNESEPGAWARELAARGTHGPRVLHAYTCRGCSWSGDHPSFTDTGGQCVERSPDDVAQFVQPEAVHGLEVRRTYAAVCPKCFAIL